ncbi:MAG: STAS domain-containing protein [Sulfuriferula sp.]
MTVAENAICVLDAVVTIPTITRVLETSKDAIKEGARIIDFHQVTEVDSTVLALIVECRREAEQAGFALRCINLPANLRGLATLYGMLDLIPQ